jgi:hypothetical protein
MALLAGRVLRDAVVLMVQSIVLLAAAYATCSAAPWASGWSSAWR